MSLFSAEPPQIRINVTVAVLRLAAGTDLTHVHFYNVSKLYVLQ